MLTLTSVQEAALNAAAEALVDLGHEINLTYSRADYDREKPFGSWIKCDKVKHGLIFSVRCATMPEAVQDALAKLAEAESKPTPIRTVAEAIAAAKDAIVESQTLGDGTVDGDALIARLEALPVE